MGDFQGFGCPYDTQTPCWLRLWVPVLDTIPNTDIKRGKVLYGKRLSIVLYCIVLYNI